MIFTLRSKTRSLEWMYQVTKVKDKSRLDAPSDKSQRIVVREYPLLLLGARECRQVYLTVQESHT